MARRAKGGALGACFDVAQMLPWWIGTLLAGGFVVTSGVFTKEAHAFASGRNIDLLDGPALVAMIGRTPRDTSTDEPIRDRPLQDTGTAQPAPTCPKCGEAMIRRIARQGANAGGSFWGCTRYPACRGIRSID